MNRSRYLFFRVTFLTLLSRCFDSLCYQERVCCVWLGRLRWVPFRMSDQPTGLAFRPKLVCFWHVLFPRSTIIRNNNSGLLCTSRLVWCDCYMSTIRLCGLTLFFCNVGHANSCLLQTCLSESDECCLVSVSVLTFASPNILQTLSFCIWYSKPNNIWFARYGIW